MAQGYKGFEQINRQATNNLRQLTQSRSAVIELPKDSKTENRQFSAVQEIPRSQVEVHPEMFQGRDTKYAEETVEKIMREGFDKSREPVVVWLGPWGKYIVISGHSRWEASERLYKAGNKSLATMPVKIFLGDQYDAVDYALLESNREVTQEGFKSDLRAYKRAKERGYNREHLKGIFKPESRLRLLEDISTLNEDGSFLSYLGTSSEKSLPYLQRNAQWVGTIRQQVPALTDAHEEELFKYLYAVGEDSSSAGKKKITITKEQFFELVNSKVSRIDFDPEAALNLDRRVSTNALTDPAREEIKSIEAEIDKLVNERDKKDELIAAALRESKTELVEKFKQRQSEINQVIQRKLAEKLKLETAIGQMETSALDLFSESEPEPTTIMSTTLTKTSDAKSLMPDDPDLDFRGYVGYNEITNAEHAWDMRRVEYQSVRSMQRTGYPHHLEKVDANEHEQLVKEALAAGKDIPDEVLEDYPQLKAQAAKKQDTEQPEQATGSGLSPAQNQDGNVKAGTALATEIARRYPGDLKGRIMVLASPGNANELHVVTPASDEAGSDAATQAASRPQPLAADDQEESNPLIGDNWFRQHPENILGEAYQDTDQYGKLVTRVRGSMENVLSGLVPHEVGESVPVPPPVPVRKKDNFENLLGDPKKKGNMQRVIQDTLKEHAEKAVRRVQGIPEKFEEGCPEEYYCFDDILQKYNEGISEAEIQAWLWYKRKSGGLNNEAVILNKKNGWSRFVIPLGQAKPHLEKWLKDGIMCLYKGSYLPSVLYYAENIYERQKDLLREKEQIIEEHGKSQFDRQWAGLEKVLPERLTLTDAQLNQRLFIKPDSEFAKGITIKELRDGTRLKTASKKEGEEAQEGALLVEGFKDWLSQRPKDEFKKSTDFNIKEYYLAKKMLPRYYKDEERLRVKQNAKKEGDEFFVRFLAEALMPVDQLLIEEQWNEIYNGYVEIDYQKIPVAFTCSNTFKNKPLFIRSAQREGIGFISVHGSGCIAYDVGVGKTMTAILSLAQAMEMGQCSRPFIVVPNQTYNNWLAELRGVVEDGKVVLSGILPQYSINELYNLSAEFIDKLRDEKGKIRPVPERSITLLTYEGFNKLCFSDGTWNVIGEELYEILHQGVEKRRNKVTLREKIEELMGKGVKGGMVQIEDLGFDYFLSDEAHAMKKSFTQVKGEITDGERKKPSYDLHSGEPSMTAIRGFMVSQYILRHNNMRNVQLLTATPFTNSPLEIYSILSLIGYQTLVRWGIRNLQDFFDTFIRTSIELVINARLEPERKEVVMGFNNLIALQQLIYKFITYKTGEDAMIQRPNKVVLPLLNRKENGKVIPLPVEQQISTNLPMTAQQKTLMLDIESYITGSRDLWELCANPAVKPGPAAGGAEKDPASDGAEKEGGKGTVLKEKYLSADEKDHARTLRGLSFARQLALSPFLYACNSRHNPTYKEYVETSPKLKYVMNCIRSVKQYHEQKNEPVSGQVIYMNAGIQFFPLLKEYLVKELGYDQTEVGIISSGINRAKKEGIKEGFQAGSVKIVIGSGTIREGINLQNRTTVLYNCWLDWNPTDVKQLEGRVWRFGNMFANVRIVNPLVEDSIDMFIFQKLEEKTSRINEIWYRTGKVNALNLEEFNPGELKMGLVTNPKALAELMLMSDRERLGDEITELLNQKALIEAIDKQREKFNTNIEYIRSKVTKYRPPRPNSPPRANSTLLKIFEEYLEDKEQRKLVKDENIYYTVRSAHYAMERGLKEILKPRGLDLQFKKDELFKKIDKEVERLKKSKEETTGKDAVALKAEEITKERKRKGYNRKTVEERVLEFSRMNPALLSELMVYNNSESKQEELKARQEKGRALEESGDTLEEMKNLVAAMEEMDKILREMSRLTAA